MHMAEMIADPAVWASFLSLCLLEIILAVDNVIFIAIASSKLPENRRARARLIGLSAGLFLRVALLFSIAWVASLTDPIATVVGFSVSWRDIILLAGGVFLIWKSANEIFLELEAEKPAKKAVYASFPAVIAQIMLLDVVFSLDSVITAVGIAEHLEVMVAAIVVAIVVMIFVAGKVANFVERHPSTKMLALAFLIMIGIALVADGLHYHIDRGFLYAGMVFAIFVEILNIIRSKRRAEG